jgi:hypothetical protein
VIEVTVVAIIYFKKRRNQGSSSELSSELEGGLLGVYEARIQGGRRSFFSVLWGCVNASCSQAEFGAA